MMMAQHYPLMRQQWVTVAPHQTPCPRSFSHRGTLAAAVLPSFRRNIVLLEVPRLLAGPPYLASVAINNLWPAATTK